MRRTSHERKIECYMYSGDQRSSISKEVYELISERIAFYLAQTEHKVMSMEVLVSKITDDAILKSQSNILWAILQTKNMMVKESLLFVSFDKPLQQSIGLTLKGKAVFQIY